MTPLSDSLAELPSDRLERAMTFRNGIVALCEGRNNMNDAVYRTLRRELMTNSNLSDLVPQFVRTAQDTGAMWAFLKGYSPQWEPRRKLVRDQFTPLIDRMENLQSNSSNMITNQDSGSSDDEEKSLYNLFISRDVDTWDGEPWTIEASRCVCVNEHTDASIVKNYGSLDDEAKRLLLKLPCIFAYEAVRKKAPKFGFIKDFVKRQGQVRVNYEIISVDRFLSDEDLSSMLFELDIDDWELNRTHWAVKKVNLATELQARGIILPNWTRSLSKPVDVSTHHFDVALSFPGEVRTLVEGVAEHLERLIGPDKYFYDNKYKAQLARPSLDILLQDIYRNRAKLIVVFLGADYQRKDWCGIEFRAIRDIIAERDHKKIMFVRTDDGAVEGVFKTDGYIDAREEKLDKIARFIKERVDLL